MKHLQFCNTFLLLLTAVYALETLRQAQNISHDTFNFLYHPSINITVQKCHCNTGHVWDRGRCMETDTFVSMVRFNPWVEKTVNSKVLSVASISRVQCAPEQLLVPLKGGSFYIVGNGDLFHLFTGLIFKRGDYCIEHVIGRRKNVRLDALVCISPPSVSRCCPKQYILDSNNYTCSYNPSVSFNPPISKEPAILRWSSIGGPFTGFPFCHGLEIFRKVNLDNLSEAALLYRSNGLFLHWKGAPSRSPYIIGPNDYCVATEIQGDRVFHSALYCDEPLLLRTAPKLLFKRQNKPYPEFYLFSVIILPVP